MSVNYINIGQAVLIRALGVQENYTEEYEFECDELDEATTGCYTCSFYQSK